MKKKFRNQSKNKTFNFLRYLGPGLLVTVGFIDPGNWASNIAAGTTLLTWESLPDFAFRRRQADISKGC